MKICIYGAGSIGASLAARLAHAGEDVSVVARGEHLAAIKRHGLVVHTADGVLTERVAASDNPHDLGLQDAVIVAVKAHAVPSVAAAPLLRSETPVVFATNGVPWWYFYRCKDLAFDTGKITALDPGGVIARNIPPHRTIGGVVYGPAAVTAPGIVEAKSRNTRLVLGEPDGSRSERASRIAAALRAAGIESEVTANIRDEIWTKLLQNIAASPLALLTGTVVRDIYQEPVCVDVGRRLLQEGAAVARAVGCTPRIDIEKLLVHMGTLAHKPSALQDLELGRPVEFDALFVAPSQIARALDVPTPTIDLITALVALRLRTAGLYEGRTEKLS